MGGKCEMLEVGVRVMVGEHYGVDFFDVTLIAGQVTQLPYRDDPCSLLSTLYKLFLAKGFVFRAPRPDANGASAVTRLRTAFTKVETMYSAKVYIRRRDSQENPDTATGVTLSLAKVPVAMEDDRGGWVFWITGQSATRTGF